MSLWKDWKAQNPNSYWSKRHDLAINKEPDLHEPRNDDVKKDIDPTLKDDIAEIL